MSLGCDGATMTMPVVPAGNAYNAGNSGFGGFGDNGAWWIIILFLFVFCGWNNNGWGNGNGGGGNSTPYIVANQGYDTRSDLQRGFDNQAVITKLDGITQGICDSTYALNNTMTNGFHGVDNAICNLGFNTQQGFNATQVAMMQGQNALQAQLANCCCETREAIQGVNYNLATQACDTRNTIQNSTRDILENQNSNSRAILDALNQNYIRSLESENQSLKLAASQSNQNAVLMAAMDANKAELLRRSGHDCPTPAYVVQPPAPVTFPTNCCGTFNGGWGNGCGNCA